MSLGLDDLNPTRRPAVTRSQPKKQPAKPVLPWSTAGLARHGLSRNDRGATETYVTDEWAELQEAPLFWIDLRSDSRVEWLRQNLARAEERLTEATQAPRALWNLIRSTLSSRRF